MIHPDRLFGRLGNRLFQNAYIYSQKLDGIVDDIYLQDPDYFDHHRDEIRKFFGTPTAMTDAVAIHYRQGDYVGNDFYVQLGGTNYYEEAMKLFPNERFLVFSDDIEKAKSYFVGKQFFFSEDMGEIGDFNLMSSCKGIIMANSSFSLWAGILRYDSSVKVICPIETKYYSDGIVRTKYPDDFVQIDFNYDSTTK